MLASLGDEFWVYVNTILYTVKPIICLIAHKPNVSKKMLSLYSNPWVQGEKKESLLSRFLRSSKKFWQIVYYYKIIIEWVPIDICLVNIKRKILIWLAVWEGNASLFQHVFNSNLLYKPHRCLLCMLFPLGIIEKSNPPQRTPQLWCFEIILS